MIRLFAVRLYYKTLYFILPRKYLRMSENLSKSRNVFLYFDYEREFGGHQTKTGDNQIIRLLETLERGSFRCTWFTVGRIFIQYPESVKEILSRGHELASHTFSHVPPLHMKRTEIGKDFDLVEKAAPVRISGFHSPKGRWSLRLLSCLRSYGYKYDLIRVPGSSKYMPFVHPLPGMSRIVRLQTVGDDWLLLGKDNTESEVLDHFRHLLNKIDPGEIAGIGVHPWILFSDSRIFAGFELFLNYLNACEDVITDTANSYVSGVM